MISIASLWMPILASAIGVFVMSSVIHMVIKYHNADYDKLPDEEAVLGALSPMQLPPGNYTMPHCTDMKDFQNPEMVAKFEKGPVAMMTVMPSGPPAMGAQLGQWFGFCVIASAFVAYIASRTIDPGADYLYVFQVTGAVAFGVYAMGEVPQSIWFGRKWGSTFRHVLDGLIFGLLTGGFFGWLWPAAG